MDKNIIIVASHVLSLKMNSYYWTKPPQVYFARNREIACLNICIFMKSIVLILFTSEAKHRLEKVQKLREYEHKYMCIFISIITGGANRTLSQSSYIQYSWAPHCWFLKVADQGHRASQTDPSETNQKVKRVWPTIWT